MQIHRNHPFLSVAQVRKLFGQLAELKDSGNVKRLHFVWPGGEPLLAGMEFFQKVVALQREFFPGEKVYNQINSNASLLNCEWINFFKDHDFDLIVGLDGPRDVNFNRRTKTGTEAHQEIMRGVAMIQASGLPLKYISVITTQVCDRAEYLYDFALKLHPATVDYIPCFDAANIASVENASYASFMTSIFDLWYNDDSHGRPKRITTLSSIIEAIAQGETSCCTFLRNCGGRLYMNASGTVRYCCNGYFDNKFTYLGNIETMSILDQFENKGSTLRRIRERVLELQERCSPCPLFCICGGGCMTQRPAKADNPIGLTHYCRARYSIIRHVLQKLREEGTTPFFA